MEKTLAAGTFLGWISYSLYIVHTPIMLGLRFFTTNDLLFSILSIVFVFGLSFWLEKWYQPFFNKLFARTQQ